MPVSQSTDTSTLVDEVGVRAWPLEAEVSPPSVGLRQLLQEPLDRCCQDVGVEVADGLDCR